MFGATTSTTFKCKTVSGKEIARKQYEALMVRIEDFVATNGHEPHLAVLVLNSSDTSANLFAKIKEEMCANVGIRCSIYRPLGDDASTWINPIRHVQELIHSLNDDERVHGIAVQYPLPATSEIDWARAFDAIRIEKDVDLQSQYSQGLMLQGRQYMWPPLAKAVRCILKEHKVLTENKQVVIACSINSISRPLSQMLMGMGAIVTHVRPDTPVYQRSSHIKQADIVITAASISGFIRSNDLRWGSTVIDLGLSREGTKTVGDVCPAARYSAGLVTPVPGGVGPVQVAMLLENTVIAAEKLVYGGTPSKVKAKEEAICE